MNIPVRWHDKQILAVMVALGLLGWHLQATEPASVNQGVKRGLAPTKESVPYGPHERQFLNFYQAQSKTPTPVVIYIHGGSWQTGSLLMVEKVKDYLKAGISVVSIEYRFVSQAFKEKIEPPVRGPLHDAARAVQFVRSKAVEWNLRKDRVALAGFSAGACSSLWLAFHPDLADPANPDPVLRESTRPYCVAVSGAQTSLDPKQMREWIVNIRYGAHAFGIGSDGMEPRKTAAFFAEFVSRRDELLPLINEYSPYTLARAGAPPVYLAYKEPPEFGKPHKNPTHAANFGVKLQERLRELGVPCELAYPGAPDIKHATAQEYLVEMLKQ
jgi:acetyl esterase/lipase